MGEENKHGYIYVLDYVCCEINEIELDEEYENDDDIERLLDSYGLRVDGVAYMYSEDKLEIEKINKLK